MKYKTIHLNERSVLKVSGSNYLNFLNNILTSDITKLKSKEITSSALLTPQGRILFDILISLSPIEKTNDFDAILIECDITQENDLLNKISMYNLRKEINIEKTNYKVFVSNDPSVYLNLLIDKRFLELTIGRIYNEPKTQNSDLEDNFTNHTDLCWYNSLRYMNCVPEGPKEIIPNVSLPLEINLDLFGGISFDKGCFIGQEVNARVKWKGLVKKKYVPITITNKDLTTIKLNQYGKNEIYFKNVEIGQIISLTYNKLEKKYFGIAIIKLTHLYDFERNTSLKCNFEDSTIEIKFPQYLLPLPRKSKTS